MLLTWIANNELAMLSKYKYFVQLFEIFHIQHPSGDNTNLFFHEAQAWIKARVWFFHE